MDIEDICYLFGLGVASIVAYKGGERRGYERYHQEEKDKEIEKLRQELNDMKRQVAFNNTNFEKP